MIFVTFHQGKVNKEKSGLYYESGFAVKQIFLTQIFKELTKVKFFLF